MFYNYLVVIYLKMIEKLLFLFNLLLQITFAVSAQVPNIVFILTDDQDVEIGGEFPITKTKALIGSKGVVFKNMFVTSPLCCPSRSSILTGRYVHNHGAQNNSLEGNCSNTYWQKNFEPKAFVTDLKTKGYETFFAGKYLNQYGFPTSGGVEHIPPGWDEWHGLVGNSRYYDYTLSANGVAEKHGSDYKADYLTDVINRKALKFLTRRKDATRPFFMMLSTPACHVPDTPAPQYSKEFVNVTAPRNGSFNHYGKDKHWLVRQAPNPIDKDLFSVMDDTFRNRWRTLLSVDDLVESVIHSLMLQKQLDNTYIVFASDNGYHLGQLSLPMDKRQMYEFDIRVPLMIRGPGIQAGQVREEIVLNIDLAPTFIDLVGALPRPEMDGQSFAPLLSLNKSSSETKSAKGLPPWRKDFIVEHSGEHNEDPGCPRFMHQNMANCYPGCVCEDSYNNTYICVRTMAGSTNMKYCEFADSEAFVEVYDLSRDPFELTNLAQTISPDLLEELNQRLIKLSICSGPSCRTLPQ